MVRSLLEQLRSLLTAWANIGPAIGCLTDRKMYPGPTMLPNKPSGACRYAAVRFGVTNPGSGMWAGLMLSGSRVA